MASSPDQIRERALAAALPVQTGRHGVPDAPLTALCSNAVLILALASLYFLTAKLGLALSLIGNSVTLIWPLSGLSLAALLIFGYRLWPGVFLGAFLANVFTDVSLFAALGIASGNTCEALLGAWLLNRLAGQPFTIDRVRAVLTLIVAAAAGSTLAGALVGATVLCSDGLVSWQQFASVLRVWWMGDALGDLVFVPAVLVWTQCDREAWSGWRWVEMINVRDITERKRAEVETLLAAKVFENTAEAIVITDAQRRVLSVNRAFLELTGYTPDEVLGTECHIFGPAHLDAAFYQGMWAAIDMTGHWQGEIWDRHKSGATYPCRLVVNSVHDASGAVSNYIAIYSDITERKQVDAQIRHLAQHDALTGLPNRLLLQDRVDQALLQSTRHGLQVALLFIDLDRFKVINDTLGHAVGDELLDAVGRRLRSCVRAVDTVARQGGDEFVIVLPEIVRPDDAAQIAGAVLTAMATPFLVRDYELHVTPSVGISVYPADGDNVQALMKNADTAMYHAKSSGGNAYHFYAARMNETAFERLVMENDLRRALERNEFVLHYQPQVELTSGRLVGVEALLRWQHPQHGLVAPRLFIPLAEETGLIVPVGEWVLREALRQARCWQEAGAPPFRMAVNISSRQFWRGNLRDTVEQVLRDTGVPASVLELELTESVLVRHETETVALLKHFSDMGVLISIDDFGTGYSSLSYLKRFPIHKLKIDQSFVRDIHEDVDDAAITTAIIAMARGLNLRVIAEGVETRAQLDFLHGLGCHEAQGYFLGHAVPAAALEPTVVAGRLWDSDDVVL